MTCRPAICANDDIFLTFKDDKKMSGITFSDAKMHPRSSIGPAPELPLLYKRGRPARKWNITFRGVFILKRERRRLTDWDGGVGPIV